MKKTLLILLSLLVVSLFVLAQSTSTLQRRQIDLNCMKNAIEKREDALKTAKTKYFNKISQAYDERKTALLNAWAIENPKPKERQMKIREAWRNFRNSIRSAYDEYKNEYAQIWNTFRQDRRNCGSGPIDENPGIDLSF